MNKFVISIALASTILVGCGTANKTAFQVTGVTASLVNGAEDFYVAQVKAGKVSQADQDKVHKAVDQYVAVTQVEQVLVTEYYAGGSTNTDLLARIGTAAANVAAVEGPLVSLLETFLTPEQLAKLNP